MELGQANIRYIYLVYENACACVRVCVCACVCACVHACRYVCALRCMRVISMICKFSVLQSMLHNCALTDIHRACSSILVIWKKWEKSFVVVCYLLMVKSRKLMKKKKVL